MMENGWMIMAKFKNKIKSSSLQMKGDAVTAVGAPKFWQEESLQAQAIVEKQKNVNWAQSSAYRTPLSPPAGGFIPRFF